MLVVLEGMPGAGKTTALRQLQEVKGVKVIDEIIDQEPEDADIDFYLQNDTRKYRQLEYGRINIMDRNFASTLCYNHCSDEQFGTDNYSHAAKLTEEALEQGLLRQPDLYIVLMCSAATSKKRQSQSNNPTWADEEFLRRVQEYYTEYFKQQKSEVLVINTDTNDIAQTMAKITNAINDTANQQQSDGRVHV